MPGDPDSSGPGPWSLPVRDFVVKKLGFSLPFELVARDPISSRQFKVQLGLPFVFSDEAGKQRDVVIGDGESWPDEVPQGTIFYFSADEDEDFPVPRLAPLRTLEDDVIDYATVRPNSMLHVEMWSERPRSCCASRTAHRALVNAEPASAGIRTG